MWMQYMVVEKDPHILDAALVMDRKVLQGVRLKSELPKGMEKI
jgi:hypothetical protein